MAMDTEEQKVTYDGFLRYTVRSVIAIVVVLGLMAIFIA